MAVYFISEENIFCGWQINCIGRHVYEVDKEMPSLEFYDQH